MSVRINWLTVSGVKLSVADRGEEMGDGRSVESPAALCIDEGDEPIIIEGRRESLAKMVSGVLAKLEPYRSADLESAVRKAKRAAYGDSNDTEIERLQEALDVALTILGRTDLREMEVEA
jgi:hypothetical protein